MLQNKINDRIGNFAGKMGIYYMDLLSGDNCFAGNCDVFPSSGMAKMPVLLEVFRQISQGQIEKEDIYILKHDSDFAVDWASYGALAFLHEGLALTVRDLYSLMITVSDNTALNILLEMVGMDRVNKTMEEWGFRNISINRAFFDTEKIRQGVENYHSVQEMGEIFRRLYLGQLISGEADREILELMKFHQRTNILPYYFKENQPIAHQTGFDEEKIHDMGVVYTERPFILCMSAGQGDTRKAESIMRDIALICFKHSEH